LETEILSEKNRENKVKEKQTERESKERE